MQNSTGSDRSSRRARRVRAVLLGLAIGLGVDLGVVIGGGLTLRSLQQSVEEQARQTQQAQQAQLAQQAQQRQLEEQEAAARPRVQVVVARTNVAAGALLNPDDFEVRDISVSDLQIAALRSLDELRGKAVSVPIAVGGQPRGDTLYEPSDLTTTAEITSVEIMPTTVTVGDTISIKVTVRNTSSSRLRTMGPGPGYTYELGGRATGATGCSTSETGAQQCWPPLRQYATWRVAVGFSGQDWIDPPYRWGLGDDVAPGASATVTGQIKITRYFDPTRFWAALVQEPSRIVQNGVGITLVTSLPAAEARVSQPMLPAAAPGQ